MTGISIIGAGKVGTSLGSALAKKSYTIKALSCSTFPSAQESQRIIGQGQPSTDNIQTARSGTILIISVPDDAVEKVVRELESSDIVWAGRSVFHCSGLLPAEILKPIREKGAATASLHPIQTIAKKDADARLFQDTYFSLEGDGDAVSTARTIVLSLGGRPLIIKAEEKPVCHAAFSIASNFFVVLLDTAVTLLESAGLDEDLAAQVLLPLVGGTFQNVKEGPIKSALTGPVIRGDEKTVKSHLDTLEEFPTVREMYRKLAAQALAITQSKKGLDSLKIRELTRLLEGK